jgi:hypothetical protein
LYINLRNRGFDIAQIGVYSTLAPPSLTTSICILLDFCS